MCKFVKTTLFYILRNLEGENYTTSPMHSALMRFFASLRMTILLLYAFHNHFRLDKVFGYKRGPVCNNF
jgi:hypothetical protein